MPLSHLPDLVYPMPVKAATIIPGTDQPDTYMTHFPNDFLHFLADVHGHIEEQKRLMRPTNIVTDSGGSIVSVHESIWATNELFMMFNPEVGDLIFKLNTTPIMHPCPFLSYGFSRVKTVDYARRRGNNTTRLGFHPFSFEEDHPGTLDHSNARSDVVAIKGGVLDIFSRHFPQFLLPPNQQSPSPLPL